MITRRSVLKLFALGSAAVVVGDVPDSEFSQESLSHLDKFRRLPRERRLEVLSQLEQSLELTETGKELKEIVASVKVPELENKSVPSGMVIYNPIQNVVYLNSLGTLGQAQLYLGGESILFARAHERIHYLQHNLSKWRSLEDFIRDHSKQQRNFETGASSITLEAADISALIRFIEQWNGKHQISEAEAVKSLKELVANFFNPQRNLIYEMQAYLSFNPIGPDQLYAGLSRNPVTSVWLSQIGREQFDQVYFKTSELLGMQKPKEAALLVASHGTSVDDYFNAIERLKKDKGINNALVQGQERQKRLQVDTDLIKRKAQEVINNAYIKQYTR